ncbi:hypothetical protein [Plantactinospora sp. CA-290183]|uniref:hypothetical protein n=1 Tax=Plantactinospora sp. CA-290183 TaxID=3240006 RepID=UPI003D89F6F2
MSAELAPAAPATPPSGTPAPAATAGPVLGGDPGRARRTERRGWWGVAALTGLIALTWAPLLGAPFGDDHVGRIIGRYALHLRNLSEQGLLGSHLGADWAPYAATPYAHHPPLLNLLTAAGGLLPGDAGYQVRLAPYLLALLVVPAGAGLLRGLGIRWSATLLALGMMAATPFYWVHSPLMFDLAPILALSAAVVRLRGSPEPPRRLVVFACVAGLLTTLVSWPGIAFAAALGLWLLAARRVDRVTVLLGGSMLVGVLLSLGFVVGITGMDLLGEQAELRSTGGSYGVVRFLRRQWWFVSALLPLWYLGALCLGVLAGLLDRRTRGYLAMATAFTLCWVLALNNGAYVHSYWSYPVLVVGLVGMAALLDRLSGPLGARLPRRFAARSRVPAGLTPWTVAATVIGSALAAYLCVVVLGPVKRELVTEPGQAGRLAADHRPPPGQRYGWIAGSGVTTPRWLAYHWRLTPRTLTPPALGSGEARADDLVLMDMRLPPEWLPAGALGQRAVARAGHYALFRAGDLRALAGV